MFGLQEISYVQFIQGIVLCLLAYYILLLLYLFLKSQTKQIASNFETGAENSQGEIKTNHVTASLQPVQRIVALEKNKESLWIKPDRHMDSAGLPLDTFTHPCTMEASQFEEELAYATTQTALS